MITITVDNQHGFTTGKPTWFNLSKKKDFEFLFPNCPYKFIETSNSGEYKITNVTPTSFELNSK